MNLKSSIFGKRDSKQDDNQATEVGAGNASNTQGSATPASEQKTQSSLNLLGMKQATWTDYESLDMEIQKSQAFAWLGLLGVPLLLLILIGGIFLIGDKGVAMAAGIPALFVGGIMAIGANIQRLQVKKLKLVRDNWDKT